MGYSERVQTAIIQALGKIGGAEVAKLYRDFLDNDNGSYLGYEVLAAVAELDDPALVTPLHAYAGKMEKRIAECKAQKKDPIFYSKFQALKNLATDIEKSLLQVKEAGNEK
jgi:ribulose kinase